MEIDRDKAIKLVIVAIATLAALAVTGAIVQLIQAVLPFLIVAAGVFVGYRWALNDSKAPTSDEMEEQARGIFSRFRRTKEAVETTVKVGTTLNNLTNLGQKDDEKDKQAETVVQGSAVKQAPAEPVPETQAETSPEPEETTEDVEAKAAEQVEEIKKSIESNPEGKIKFKDKDVVISKDDLVQPDISRLEEKEKEAPKVTNDVLAQIEERRRRLQQGGE